MKIVRPYEATENEINASMQRVLTRYAKKHNLEIEKMSVYEKAVSIDTTNGKHYMMNIADCSRLTNRNITDYFYMKTTVNGKQKRIPKSEW